jgi:hypothetical protein
MAAKLEAFGFEDRHVYGLLEEAKHGSSLRIWDVARQTKRDALVHRHRVVNTSNDCLHSPRCRQSA